MPFCRVEDLTPIVFQRNGFSSPNTRQVDAAVRFPDGGGLGYVSVEVRAAGQTGPYQGAPETVEVVCAIAAKRGRQSTARWTGS